MRGKEVIQEVTERRQITDAAMRFFSIIPDQVLHQFTIEGIQDIQVIDESVNELMLNSHNESFQVAVVLRMFMVIEEVNEAGFPAIVIEVFFEFTAVIGLDSCSGEECKCNELAKGVAYPRWGARLAVRSSITS